MILVLAEHDGVDLKPISLETLALAARLGEDLDQPVAVALLGSEVSSLAAKLGTTKVDRILRVESPVLESYSPEGYVAAAERLLDAESPAIVLTGHTTQGVDFLPRLAARRRAPIVAASVGYEIQGSRTLWTRQVFNGKMHMRVRPKSDGLCLVLVAPGAFAAEDAVRTEVAADGEVAAGGEGRADASVEVFPVELDDVVVGRRVVERVEAEASEASLDEADIIVTAGRGLKEKENLGLVFELAEALGGAVGASRPVVDSEWLPRDRQIGSSGRTVSPRLYIALGVSGAIQHLVGMQTAQCIVAINQDKDAPIFKVAHYGIVDDLFKVVPELTRIVKELKGAAAG